jgi:hypothetical protein
VTGQNYRLDAVEVAVVDLDPLPDGFLGMQSYSSSSVLEGWCCVLLQHLQSWLMQRLSMKQWETCCSFSFALIRLRPLPP